MKSSEVLRLPDGLMVDMIRSARYPSSLESSVWQDRSMRRTSQIEGWRSIGGFHLNRRPKGRNVSEIQVRSVCGLTLYLLDVQPESSQHEPDRYEGYSEPETAMIALNHGLLPSLQVLGGDLQAGLNILVYQVRPEAMDRDSSFGLRIPSLILSQSSLAHLHARRLSDTENLVRAFDGLVQLIQAAL